jgi:hypothetical protein
VAGALLSVRRALRGRAPLTGLTGRASGGPDSAWPPGWPAAVLLACGDVRDLW